MESAFEDATVTSYERLVAAMTNDPHDRRVLAAAVRGGAHAMITDNVKDFRPESASPHLNSEIPPLWSVATDLSQQGDGYKHPGQTSPARDQDSAVG
jgi:hypothetical protein